MWRRITAALLTLLVLVAHQIPANAVPVAISPTPNSDALVPHVVPTLPNLGLLPVVHLERRQTAGTLYYDFNTSFVNLNFANVLAASPRPSNLPTSSQLPTEDQLKETASATKASASLGSFTAWINGAATWRKSLRGAWTYTGPNSIPQSSSQYGTFITSNFLGLVIFVGFCIVVAVLGLVLSPCCCCCFVCRKPKARDGNRFTFLRITVLIAFIMQLVFCVSMFIGTGTLSKGVSMTLGSSLSTITNVQILNYNLNPVLVNTLPLVSNGVSAVVSGMTDPSFITTWVSSTLQPSGSQLSTDLNTAQTRLTTAKTALTGLQVSVPALVSDVNSLQTSINALIPAANALNSQQTVPTTNEQYTLASSISVPAANSVALPTVASPPTSAISSALSTINGIPDLAALGNTITTQINTVGPQITNTLNTVNTQLQTAIGNAVTQATSMVNSMTDVHQSGSVTAQVSQAISPALQQVSAIGGQASSYSGSVNYGAIGFGVVLLLGFLATGISVAVKRGANVARCCGCCNLLLACLLFWLTTIYVVLTMGIAEVCSELQGPKPMSQVAQAINMPQIPGYTTMALKTLDTCASNPAASIFTALNSADAATVLGVQGTISTFDLGVLAGTAVDGLNVAQLTSNLPSASSMVNLNSGSGSSSVTTQLNSLTGTNSPVSSFDFSYLNSLPATIDVSSLTTLKNNLVTLRGQITTSAGLTYASGAYTNTQKQNCVADIQSRIDAVVTQISAALTTANSVSTDLTTVGSQGSSLSTTVPLITASANSVLADYNSLVAIVTTFIGTTAQQTVNTRVANARTTLVDMARGFDAVVAAQLPCGPVAQSLLATVNGVCTLTLGGLDAMWMGFFLAASVAYWAFFALVKVGRAIRVHYSGTYVVVGTSSAVEMGGKKGGKKGATGAPLRVSPMASAPISPSK